MTKEGVFQDPRSKKVVIVPDYVVNPGRYNEMPNSYSVFEKLRDSGFGLIKMPPLATSGSTLEAWLKITADQVEEYTNRGFRVYALSVEGLPEGGIGVSGLGRELRSRGVSFPQIVVLPKGALAPPKVQEILEPMLH